jgi:predicted permease
MLKIDYPSLTGVIVIGIDWYQFSIINRTNVNIHLPLALINSIHTQLPKAA